MSSDTLILASDFFNKTVDSLTPKNKNFDMHGVDKYLIKRNKLFIVNKAGQKKDCYLKSKQ